MHVLTATGRAPAERIELDDVDRALLSRHAPSAHVVSVRRLPGGSSLLTAAVALQHDAGATETVVLRQAPPAWRTERPSAVRRECQVLQIVARQGIPAPTPLLDPTTMPSDRALLRFMPGPMAVSCPSPKAFARALAEQMHQIHQIPSAEVDFLPVRQQLLNETLATHPSHPDQRLNEAAIRTALNRHPPPAPDLPSTESLVLLHGDLWPGNVLVAGNTITAILDWEDAQLGHPLADVAITRLDLTWAYEANSAHAFTAQYAALSGRSMEQLPYWDLWAAMRPMGQLSQWAADWPSFGRPDVTLQTMTAAHRTFAAAALRQLD